MISIRKNTVFCWVFLLLLSGFRAGAEHYRNVLLVVPDAPSPIENNIFDLLKQRLSENSGVKISRQKLSEYRRSAKEEPGTLLIFPGVTSANPALNDLVSQERIPPVSQGNPGPEGFLLYTVAGSPGKAGKIIMAGADHRGLLYAAGAFLRECAYHAETIALDKISLRTAPAFEVRGTQYGQSHVALGKAKVRRWTKSEKERAILDLALAGANVFMVEKSGQAEQEDIAFLKSFDLMTSTTFNPNQAPDTHFPVAWRAAESIGRLNYFCLSVPEARQHILDECEKRFSKSPAFDFIQLKGGDGGGCECDRCRPYGDVFIRLSEKIAGIIHRYHPGTKLYFTNQKFDNEGDSAILSYLNEKPREWLWAWGYGPGSDATTWQPGHRQNHRMDLFRYPGFGPYGLYPKELLHQLPGRHKILYFNEITHWKYSQHGYIQMYPRADKDGNLPPHWSREIYERRPDQALTMVYDRLSFFVWPKYYHRVFNDLMRYGAGDITHSSGNHDHFNQWMWQRLLWNPRLEVAEVVGEYAASWFGKEAAPLMSKAILQLETNMEELKDEPLQLKEGIERYYSHVEEAGKKIPAHLMKRNWLWRMYMQKGALDLYVKLDLKQQLSAKERIEEYIRTNRAEMDWDYLTRLIQEALTNETPDMIRLRNEAARLGEESNELFGTRSDGLFSLRHDYVGMGWISRQLARARETTTKERCFELLEMVYDYEGKSLNALYDNLGTGNDAPNVAAGYPYDHGQPYVSTMLSESNRPSQRSMHFTQDEEQGVTLQYRDLEPGRDYRLRLTLVRPVFQERYVERMKQKTQAVYANGQLLARELALPEGMSDFFTFDIPATLIQSGSLEVKLMKDPDVLPDDRVAVEQWRNTGGWGTLLSEAWLIPVK